MGRIGTFDLLGDVAAVGELPGKWPGLYFWIRLFAWVELVVSFLKSPETFRV